MHTNRPDIWSLWTVPSRGLILVHDDVPGVLVQEVVVAADTDEELPTLVAVSKSPSARRTVLRGGGGHTDAFETALSSHLEMLDIDRRIAERVDVEDLMPVGASARPIAGATP